MRAVDIIAAKRDGNELTPEQIAFAIRGYTRGDIPDYQIAALLVAIYIRGMSRAETLTLTKEMLDSGEVVDFRDSTARPVDKHSTGGVGDKTSLVVAPVVAAAGVPVPMISGRALGHSGGTLDKLESIPGFRTSLSLDEFRSVLRTTGAALIGQTEEIAPADRKLYSLRDVTATVASIPLMAASIMSKKMAEGISGLVLDVKVGSGAFLKREEQALELADLMMEIARGLGRDCVALLTDMNQPLGQAVGNSIEVIESLETLKGRGPEDLTLLCRELAAEMLKLGGAAHSIEAGRKRFNDLIASGAALRKMKEIIRAQGGDERVMDDYSRMPRAAGRMEIRALETGFVQSIDTESLGAASMLLGAGRTRLDSRIDPAAGLMVIARIGDRVEKGATLAIAQYNDGAPVEDAADRVRKAYRIGERAARPPSLIKARLTNDSGERYET